MCKAARKSFRLELQEARLSPVELLAIACHSGEQRLLLHVQDALDLWLLCVLLRLLVFLVILLAVVSLTHGSLLFKIVVEGAGCLLSHRPEEANMLRSLFTENIT